MDTLSVLITPGLTEPRAAHAAAGELLQLLVASLRGRGRRGTCQRAGGVLQGCSGMREKGSRVLPR